MLRPENTSGHMFLADAEINETADRELQLFMTHHDNRSPNISLPSCFCLFIIGFGSLKIQFKRCVIYKPSNY